MQGSGVLSSADEERAEIATVMEALARSPRLVHLLRYIGEKYFRGESDQLKEFNIAIEVFGRPANFFNPTDDAIARVEAHRLRKRLKEYYETEGKDHSIQISIPFGTYVPVFTHRTSSLNATPAAEQAASAPAPLAMPVAAQPISAKETVPAWRRERIWLFVVVASIGLMVAVGGIRLLRRPQTALMTNPGMQSQAGSAPTRQVPPIDAASVPLRLMAGYSQAPIVDSSGAVWDADRYFQGGRPAHRGLIFTGRTNRTPLFQQWRSGEFSYEIPLKPGVYELHLYFVESGYGPGLQGSPNDDTFTVRINGDIVLSAFDIESDALGPNIADERIFKDIHPGPDGKLRLTFQGERGIPYLSAIEVLQGLPHQQIPIRLITQPSSFTDGGGRFWRPDDYYLDGAVSHPVSSVSGTSDPDLFAGERFGHFTYAIPVDTHGQYTVILHFAEFYFGPQAPGLGGPGDRIFNVMCNGVMLLDHFDIFKEAGSLHTISKTFYHVKPTAQGKLNLTFEPVVNNATISGIEVLDESQ
jgi:Malectin domain